MRPYTFYLHERRSDGPSFRFISCESDGAAQLEAYGLFEVMPDLVAVEIYDGRTSRVRIGRPQDAPPARQAAAS